ncbi:hypothetical protein ACEPAI_2797 [Sanghuangporus weigelae]
MTSVFLQWSLRAVLMHYTNEVGRYGDSSLDSLYADLELDCGLSSIIGRRLKRSMSQLDSDVKQLYPTKRIAAPWIVLMVYDAAVFFLTLRKALQIWKLGSSRLFQILIRDGSIFFFVMTMANLSNVLVLILAPPFLKDVCTTFTSGISVTMVSRLMLNIQNPILLEEPITRSYCGTPEVGTLVANLAEDDTQLITSTTWTVEGQ